MADRVPDASPDQSGQRVRHAFFIARQSRVRRRAIAAFSPAPAAIAPRRACLLQRRKSVSPSCNIDAM